MLILPLHQPLTRANFPWITAALVLLNVLVFLLLQSGDHGAERAASEYYQQAGLAKIETPLYRQHLAGSDESEQQEAFADMPPALQSEALTLWSQHDPEFRQRLAKGELFESPDDFAAWQPLGQEFDRRLARAFTTRHALHADHPTLGSLLSSQFLHGGVDHLLGNMLFLIALGLLVEGPLGPGLFAALYLTGGIAAGGAWVLANPNGGSLIGASGAIAGLMGAFCVLWGMRKVRYFYWFFVVFDYVKGPALALLPLWLGWELLQWLSSDGSRVAYEAHAGGIVSGALLALAVRRLGWQREAYFERAEAPAPLSNEQELRLALDHLGHLRINEAEILLAGLAAREPGRFDIAQARLRCARYGGDRGRLLAQLQAFVGFPATTPAHLREQAAALSELQALGGNCAAPQRLGLAQRLAAIGDHDAAWALLRDLADAPQIQADLPQAWLGLARRYHEHGAGASARSVLEKLQQRFPASPEAAKAVFLLGEWR